ncbi:MAG: hypothetical protein SFV23_06895, partial [Planctomycetaceae bacterium]|nr:hypothetical protein [Planctomycetaceae bacterium]
RARVGDLMLMYRCRPVSAITDVYRLEGNQQRKPAEWRAGECYDAPVRRLMRLKSPITLLRLKEHRLLRTSGFVRGNMQGVRQISDYWPTLFQLIAVDDSVAAKRLAKYSPERMSRM